MSKLISTQEEPEMFRFFVANGALPSLANNYVLKGVLGRSETSMWYGDSNCGKTAVMLRIGATICKGERFDDARVRKGAVIHIAAEGARSVWLRTTPLLGPEELRAEHAEPDAIIEEAPYMVWPGRLDLRDHGQCEAFATAAKRSCAEHGVDLSLVIVDTTVLCLGDGDDALTRDATEAVEGAKIIARSTRAHVSLIHHTGRDAERGHRGAAAWRSNVDAMFVVKVVEGDGERWTEVRDEKMRDAKRDRVWRFSIDGHQIGVDEDGDPVTVAVATLMNGKPISEDSGGPNRSLAVECALDALQRSQGAIGSGFAPSEVWRLCPAEAFAGIADVENQKKAVSRILHALAKSPASRVMAVGKARFALRTIEAPVARAA
jgi:hypothetical protein